MVKHGLGAIEGLLEQQNGAIAVHLDEGARRRLAGHFSGNRRLAMYLLGREIAGESMIFENFFTILSMEISSTSTSTHWAKQGGPHKLLWWRKCQSLFWVANRGPGEPKGSLWYMSLVWGLTQQCSHSTTLFASGW